MRKTIAAFGAVTIVAAALAFGGCGGDSGGNSADNEAIQQQLDDINTALEGIRARLDFEDLSLRRQQSLSAMTVLKTEDLDGLAAETESASEVDPAWFRRAERMLRALQAVEWPPEFQERGFAIENSFFELLNAVTNKDLPGAASAAAAARDGWHGIEEEIYTYVAGPDAEHGHAHTATPTAAP